MHRGLKFVILVLGTAALMGADECTSTGVAVYEDEALDGYTLLSDYLGQEAVLIDMEGNVVRDWPVVVFPAKMLPGGYIIAGGDSMNPNSPWINPDVKEIVQYNWDGDAVGSFSDWDDQGTGTMMARFHHDFEREGSPVGYFSPGKAPLVSGKTLVLAHKDDLVPEITDYPIQDDVLYEIDAAGNLTGWEWHASDHIDEFGLSQEARDALRVDCNYEEISGLCDYLHSNSASYLGENKWYDAGDDRFRPDNIILDSRNANFIVIIDKDTGDVVWRVGPDYTEDTPYYGIGQMQGQHNAHMIPQGLPGEGNILVFDNGGESGYGGPNNYPLYEQRGWSRVVEFDPTTYEVVWEYGTQPGDVEFYSQYISNAQRLPNGNTLITIGMDSRVIEVTPDHELVWDYTYYRDSWFYRAYRIPPEWLPDGANEGGYARWERGQGGSEE